MNAVVL